MQTILFPSAPFGLTGDTDFKQVGTLLPLASGLYNVQWGPTPSNGVVPVNPQSILSVQPDGTFQTRPLQVAPGGNYEQFKLVGETLCIRPNWFNGAAIFPNTPTIGYVIAIKVIG